MNVVREYRSTTSLWKATAKVPALIQSFQDSSIPILRPKAMVWGQGIIDSTFQVVSRQTVYIVIT
jgi:hypothetical protein